MTATIIGLDPSLSASGIAVWRKGSPLYLGTIRSELWGDVHGWDFPARLDRIMSHVMEWVDDPHETVVTVEGLIKPSQEASRGTSTLDLAQLRGVIVTDLYRRRIPINTVHLATLKKFAKAGNCSKLDMIQAARTVLGTQYPVTDDNQADAFWLLAMTLQAHAMPVVRRTPRRDDAVARIRWSTIHLGGK